jgi:hypothetical protein
MHRQTFSYTKTKTYGKSSMSFLSRHEPGFSTVSSNLISKKSAGAKARQPRGWSANTFAPGALLAQT